jgi:hypothetical protein
MPGPKPIRRFVALPRHDRQLALEAWLWLGLARGAVRTLPFRWVTAWCGCAGPLDAVDPHSDPDLPRDIVAVAAAIQRASRHTPWRSNCLAQAIAGKWMLRRRHVSTRLCFGVGKDARRRFDAHAWLQVGSTTILGGHAAGRYAIVGTFADRPRHGS